MKTLLISVLLACSAWGQIQTLNGNDIVRTVGKAKINANFSYLDTQVNAKLQLDSLGRIPAANGSLLTGLTQAQISGLISALAGMEPALGNPSVDGYVLAGWTNGTRAWVANGSGGGSMTYPADGVPVASGGSWGASLTVGVGANNLVQLDSSARLPAVNASLLTGFPTFNQNTTGTAAGLTAQYIDWTPTTGGASIKNKPTIPVSYSLLPPMDGTANAGASAAFSRGDHVHPTDTSRAASNAATTVNGVACTLGSTCTITAVPGFHASSHGVIGADPVTVAESQVTGLPGHLNGKEPALGNPASDGYVLASSAAGVRTWVANGGGGGSMTYPPDGIPVAASGAWSTSLAAGTSAGNLVQLNGSAQLPAVSAALLTNFPTFNQSTSGTAANVSGIVSPAHGGTGTNITPGAAGHVLRSDGTKYVDAAIQAADVPTLNQSTTGTAAGLAAQYVDYTAASGPTSIKNKPFRASGTVALRTAAISPNACGVTTTIAIAGVLDTDVLLASARGNISGVVGYSYTLNDGLMVYDWTDTGTVNFLQCNHTTSAITPGAASFNWEIAR